MTDTPITPLHARISKGFRYRLLAIGAGLTAFGCWALYDGAVKYPKQAEVYAELEAMQAEHEDWASRWVSYAEERGYEPNPNEVKQTQTHDIATQYVMAALCLPVGGFFLFNFFRAGGRFVEADEAGIRSRDASASWEEVRDLDDSRWRTKGISRVQFRREDGSEGSVLLDDWKFEREPTVAIHDLAMRKLGRTPEGGAVEAAEGPAEEAATAEVEREPAEGEDQPLRP